MGTHGHRGHTDIWGYMDCGAYRCMRVVCMYGGIWTYGEHTDIWGA